ncbi:MAG: saccharopine dehydrogenase NADP-binding domain-containing protein [Microscillaceae bacterium]|nr:saccharopine dehydrogenase NADP-binding domain-containing protein [Microscillaceae bacterium]
MEKNKILVYGAGGYVGKLLLKMLADTPYNIVVGARTALETTYPMRVFSLGNSAEIITQLQDIQLVINLAGAFRFTNKPLVEACLATQTHYIDIAGEYNEVKTVFGYDEQAKKAQIMLMPAAGFGVVPTDLVANLAFQKLPDATHLKIAYVTLGGASRGTLKTVLADINQEGVKLLNGIYQKAKPASQTFALPTAQKNYRLVYNPWRADLFTAQISTQIPNIETYSYFPNFIVKMMQGKMLWLRDLMLKRLLRFLPEGPSAKQLHKGSTICYAEVSNEKGEKAQATILGPEAYLFTVYTLWAITEKVMANDFEVGFQTPHLYGTALLSKIPSVRVEA